MSAPKCEKCGNDGSAAGLYLTIDARFDPAAKGWKLEEREDSGGASFDCLNCDHRTEAWGEDACFPYDHVLSAETFVIAAVAKNMLDFIRMVAAGNTEIADLERDAARIISSIEEA